MNSAEEDIRAVKKAHHDFAKIMSLEKCRTCSCMHTDMLAAILDFIRSVRKKKDDPVLSLAEKDFTKWLKGAEPGHMHQ